MSNTTSTPLRHIQARPDPSYSNQTILCGRDKSLTHRAIMFAALASGESVIHLPLLGADCLSTMSCFRALGVTITALNAETLVIHSNGSAAFHSPLQDLDCGNSGTTARLMCGILAAQPQLKTRLIGYKSLSQRPMGRVTGPLKLMGATIEGEHRGTLLPLAITGRKLEPQAHKIDKASAQVKSAILLAALFCEGETEIQLPAGSRDHTEKMLLHMGAPLTQSIADGLETIRFQGPFVPLAGQYRIPVDPSSAAFFCVLGLLRPQGHLFMPEVLSNLTRTGFLRVLSRMSSGLSLQPDFDYRFVEPTMQICVAGGSQLLASDIEASEVPSLVDEIPILAVAAAFAEGPSVFHGLEELRLKESDRLSKTAELLNLAGAKVTINGDSLHIGGGLREVVPFTFDSIGDHRLAMAAAVMARQCKKPCCILDSECVGVSFPEFYRVLDSID